MPLTDIECRNASCLSGKARARYTDAAGLYLEVAATGSKRWFWKYYFDGKEMTCLGFFEPIIPGGRLGCE
jgi:hypothetical protein